MHFFRFILPLHQQIGPMKYRMLEPDNLCKAGSISWNKFLRTLYSLEASTDQSVRKHHLFFCPGKWSRFFFQHVFMDLCIPSPKTHSAKNIMDLCTYLVCLLFCFPPPNRPLICRFLSVSSVPTGVGIQYALPFPVSVFCCGKGWNLEAAPWGSLVGLAKCVRGPGNGLRNPTKIQLRTHLIQSNPTN
jgi:hypothetical protein